MVIQALQTVFRKPTYVILTLFVSVLVFVFAVWLPNIKLITSVIGSSDISLLSKFELLLSLLGSIRTNFTVLSASYTIIIAVLFGIYLSMLIYFIKNRLRDISQSGITTGALGTISGILGVGCTACGAFLLTSVLSTFGIAGIVRYLPLNGGEFGIVGFILLVVSIYITAKKIMSPQVCSINN